ncbi:MAG: fumarylacetoacetate hydrolase family protein [Acidimicrobiia bacterium]|nr:fumarylacetoacetate hydrolase family protein [Acidimicrobiia bacterium]
MRTSRTFLTLVIPVLMLGGSALVSAQGNPVISSAEPFKLGTFDIAGDTRIGIVLRDALVVELGAANRALERDPAYPPIPMPPTMVDLIGRYEYGMKTRLYEIVNYLVRANRLAGTNRPAWVHDVKTVDILAPLMPGKMLNAAVNFYTHVGETGSAEEQKKAEAERRAKRGIPYLFLKPTRGAVIGDGDNVVIPYGRDRVDWEVELGIVIGRAARDVPADKAADHIFGYTVTVDVSDRGGRPPDSRPGSDWLVGKGHDTFAPMGPWIVPKEFYGDPMKRLRQTLTVDGKVMQEGGAADMIHSIYELIEYGSSIITLFPGDVLNNGTSGGTGMGQAYRGAERFLKPGEKMVASIDGIGTITMSVVSEPAPSPGTGSRLPPVSTYRK